MSLKSIINNIRRITTRKEKLSILIISFFTFVALILEVIGIAILIPILSVLSSETKQNAFLTNEINRISEFFGFNDKLIFLLLLMFLVYLVKSVYLIFLNYRQKSFISNFINTIVDNLFIRYGSQPILYFNKKNSSSIVQIIQSESYFLFLFFENVLLIISEFLLVLCFLIFMVIYDPNLFFFSIFFFGILMLIYFLSTRSKFYKWGKQRVDYDQKISKLLIEVFGSIKEIFVYNTLEYFKTKIKLLNKSKYKLYTYKLTLDTIPKIYFEFSTIIFLISYIYYLNELNYNISDIIINLGVLIAVSYKVIPSLTKISNSFQNLKNYSSSLELINKEYDDAPLIMDKRNKIKEFSKSIIFSNLSFSYNNEKEYIFRDFNLKINKNQFIGIVGESGSGKTTLLDLIAGLIEKSSGDIIIDGKKINKNEVWKPNIGYVSQKTFIINDSIKENIRFSRINDKNDSQLLISSSSDAQIKNWINSLEYSFDTSISQNGSNISGGQIQRIGIARALYKNSDFLIFDEPTSALDNITEKQIMETIYSLKDKTVIIVSHKKSILENCDKIIEIT